MPADFSSISSFPVLPTTINDQGNQEDVSADQGSIQSPKTDSTENVHLAKTVSAALEDSYNGSSTVIAHPLSQLTSQDLANLATLSAQDISAGGTTAVNSSTSSAVLAIFEVYLKNQQKIESEYIEAGAPHQDVTSHYQQEMTESSAGSSLPFVASTALSVQQSVDSDTKASATSQEHAVLHHVHRTTRKEGSTLGEIAQLYNDPMTLLRNIGRNNDTLTHHSNLEESRKNVVGRDSRHNLARRLFGGEEIRNNHNKESGSGLTVATSTATYDNAEALDALKKDLSEISTENLLATIEAANARNSQARNTQEEKILSKGAVHNHSERIGSSSSSPTDFTSNQPFVDGKIIGLATNGVDTNSAISAEFGGAAAAAVNQSNFAAALLQSMHTLSAVTSTLRPQPIGHI